MSYVNSSPRTLTTLITVAKNEGSMVAPHKHFPCKLTCGSMVAMSCVPKGNCVSTNVCKLMHLYIK